MVLISMPGDGWRLMALIHARTVSLVRYTVSAVADFDPATTNAICTNEHEIGFAEPVWFGGRFCFRSQPAREQPAGRVLALVQ